jgi:integrase
VARRRSASLQARHQPGCKTGKAWTTFDDARKGCNCTPGPLYHVVTRARVDGAEKQVRTPVGRDREQARRELLKVLGELDQGTYQPPKDVTFSEWADQWFAGLEHGRPRASTRRVYGQTVRRSKEAFGGKLVRHVTTTDVVDFLNSLGEVTSTTKRRHLRVLGSCLEAAVRHRPPLANYNAVRELSEQQRPQADTRKASPFEAAELEKLWQKIPTPYKVMAKLSAATGMRQGEIIALRWGAVDLEKRVISVRESYVQGLGFQEPKSADSNREVILTPKVVEMLKTWKKESGHLPLAEALVFVGAGRDGQVVDTTLRRALYDAMTEAKISRLWKHGHKQRDFHSFRHTFVSLAIGQGIGLEWIAEQLGHSSIAITERVYKHFLTEARQAQATALDAALVV